MMKENTLESKYSDIFTNPLFDVIYFHYKNGILHT